MAIEPIPKFHGQIVVDATNNKIDFFEAIALDLTATVVDGTYWPEEYVIALDVAMNAALAGFSVSLSDTTGLLSISRPSGWYPKITNAETNKCLTGGDLNVDRDSALFTGEIAPNHGGFVQDSIYPGQATTHTSDQWIGSSYWPDESPAEDPKFELKKVVRVATTPRGDMYHADYTGKGRGIEQRTLRFEYQTTTTRSAQADTWWRWYASQGSLIRYYPDRDSPSYQAYKLVEESAKEEAFRRQFQGFAYFQGSFTLQRAWDQVEIP